MIKSRLKSPIKSEVLQQQKLITKCRI